MAPDGMGTSLENISDGLLSGGTSKFEAGEKRLAGWVIGKQHHQNQHDGIHQHSIVRELPQQLRKDRQRGGGDDGAADIAHENTDCLLFV